MAFQRDREYRNYGRRYTSRSSQVQHSFEHTSLNQRALDLITAAKARRRCDDETTGHPNPESRHGRRIVVVRGTREAPPSQTADEHRQSSDWQDCGEPREAMARRGTR